MSSIVEAVALQPWRGKACVDAPFDASTSFGRLGACGQVLSCVGLSVRHVTRRGPLWRCADRVHIAYASSNALYPEAGFPDPVSIDRLPLPFLRPARDLGDLPNYRTHRHRLYGEQEGNCVGCNTHFPFRVMEMDHILPCSKGGTDHPDNLQLLCSGCNRSKGDKTMPQWRAAQVGAGDHVVHTRDGRRRDRTPPQSATPPLKDAAGQAASTHQETETMALRNPRPMARGEKLEIAPGANSIRLEQAPKDPNTLAVDPEWQLVFSYGHGSEFLVPLEDGALSNLKKIALVANAAEMG